MTDLPSRITAVLDAATMPLTADHIAALAECQPTDFTRWYNDAAWAWWDYQQIAGKPGWLYVKRLLPDARAPRFVRSERAYDDSGITRAGRRELEVRV